MPNFPLPKFDEQAKPLPYLGKVFPCPMPTQQQGQLITEGAERLLIYDFQSKSASILDSDNDLGSQDCPSLNQAFISDSAPTVDFHCQGTINRTQVADSTKFPFSTVCRVLIEYGEGIFSSGTGVLIGKDCVLTCGHLFTQNEIFPRNVYVEPGLEKEYLPFGRIKVKKISLIESFLSNAASENDFSLLLLEEEIGLSTGWVGISQTPLFKDEEIVTIGYPADLSPAEFQYQDCGNLIKKDDFLAHYNYFVFGGQSGSPVCAKSGFSTRDSTVFSILTTSSGGMSFGTLLNNEKISFIKEFRKHFR